LAAPKRKCGTIHLGTFRDFRGLNMLKDGLRLQEGWGEPFAKPPALQGFSRGLLQNWHVPKHTLENHGVTLFLSLSPACRKAFGTREIWLCRRHLLHADLCPVKAAFMPEKCPQPEVGRGL
jgi:hypothetical protein